MLHISIRSIVKIQLFFSFVRGRNKDTAKINLTISVFVLRIKISEKNIKLTSK